MEREAMNRHFVGNNVDIEGQNRQDLLHCGSCHRTYRPNQMDHNTRQTRYPPRGNSAMYGFHQQRPSDSGRNIFYSDFDLRNLKRETRNVTFALDSPKRSQGDDGESEETTSPRGKDGRQDRRSKLQANRPIKVKLNLNPLRKSKVHPKKKADEKGSPRKNKDKSGNKEGRKKSKKSKDKEIKPSEQNTGDETVAQMTPLNPMAHMQGFLGAQFRGGGMLLGNRSTNLLGSSGPQLPTSSLPFQAGNLMAQGKPMFPTSPMGSNLNLSGPSMGPGGTPTMAFMNSSNLSLANAIQPHQTNLSIASLQASPATLQANATQGSPTTLQANASTFQSSVVVQQPNANLLQANPTMSQGNTVVQGSSGTKQASSTILPANATSQASSTAKQTSPTLSANSSSQNLQALATLAPPPSSATSGAQSGSKSSPKSSPRGKSKNVQETVPQSSNKTNTGTLETPTSPRKESERPIMTGDSQNVAPLNTPAATMVKNMSNTSLTESVHGGAMHNVTQAELPTGGITAVGGTQGADVSVSNVHAPTESIENIASTTLIQQEYLSEDGGTSPKRKLRLVIPEKTTNRPLTALERKIR
ncbi:hypothetical protein NQD34_012906 [Periophthalmus magnuspinnatus]|nr:hypothetical protein NQD34_012906 [Periophthalmus magnuspinnatus]